MKKMIGFTLIELMIVIAIIGILVAVVAPHIFPSAGMQTQHRSDVPVRKPIPTRDGQGLDAEAVRQISNDGPIFACVDGKLYLNAVYMNKGCDLNADGIAFKP